MNPLVIIPARGGSKGIVGKNTKILIDKPLIYYTIETAQQLFPNEVICVSTDSSEIIKTVENIGLRVPFVRPSELATDESGTYEVIIHALNYYESINYKPDYVILLQATSPLRKKEHILEALKLFDNQCDMVISVKKTKANPYYVLMEESHEGWLIHSKPGNFKRRQDTPVVWELNGSIYIINVNSLKKHTGFSEFKKIRKYEMEEIYSIDIDSMLEWNFAEMILSKKLIY